jgi:spermidine synthase
MPNSDIRLKDFQKKFNKASSKKLSYEPFVYDEHTTLSMHFDLHSIQSVMLKSDPESLVFSYTRVMMGFLFFQPEPEHIAMIGLGGGSLAKYCLKYLPNAHFTAIEISSQVIALREEFSIPADSDKFKVLHANGADFVANQSDKVDVLLVDGFDENGQPPILCSTDFYNNCYSKLRDGGVMVVNLHGSDINLGTYASRICDSFENKLIVVDAEGDGNKIAFAYKGKEFPLTKEILFDKIHKLGSKHPFALHDSTQKITQWLKKYSLYSAWKKFLGAGL